MKKLAFLFLISCFVAINAQNNFNYQAVIRDAEGTVLEDTPVMIKFTILENGVDGNPIYSEEHASSTNSQGLITLLIGEGTNSTGDMQSIDWSGSGHHLKVEAILPNASTYTLLGTDPINPVPIAIHATNATSAESATTAQTAVTAESATTAVLANTALTLYNPENNIVGIGDISQNPTGALFAVKNIKGDTVFAVYNEGVRIYVDESPLKATGSKAGFAVGGIRAQKATGPEQNYFVITPDSARIYFNESAGLKATGSKAGFAVGGIRAQKATGSNIKPYFDVSPVTSIQRVDSSDRVLWFPERSALLAGNVNFPEGKTVGQYSISLGFRPFASGSNSTAIGNYAKAEGQNSYALGDSAVAATDNAYAMGTFSRSQGLHSYAFGSSSLAEGDFSFALGTGAVSEGIGSFAFGAVGLDTNGATTGSPTTAIGNYSFAIGRGSVSEGYGALSMGLNSKAVGNYSIAFGTSNKSEGYASTTIGYGNYANSYKTFVVGTYNATNSNHSMDTWEDSDPIFVVGNGKGTTYRFLGLKSGSTTKGGFIFDPIIKPINPINPIIPIIPLLTTNRSNAMMVFKSGNMLIGGGSTYTTDPNSRLSIYMQNGNVTTPSDQVGLVINKPYYNHAPSLKIFNNEYYYNFFIGNWMYGNFLRFEVNENGNTGIGSSASDSYRLYVSGTSYFSNNVTIFGAATVNNGIAVTSDLRFKTNITPISSALSTIISLKGVRYNWRINEFKERNFEDKEQIGFIAQEVEEVLPELVKTGADGYKAIEYSKVVPVMVEAMKEQQQMIEDQQKVIDDLLKRVEALEE